MIIGTGLLKPNVSAMVGQLYTPEDRRRDAGFSIYYMGINLGAFLSPFLTGWLAQGRAVPRDPGLIGLDPGDSWHWGFGMAAVGMFFGLMQYMAGWKYLGEAGIEPVPPGVPRPGGPAISAAGGLGHRLPAGLVAGRLDPDWKAVHYAGADLADDWLSVDRCRGGDVRLAAPSRGWTAGERKRLLVILVLFAASSVFWAVYEQAGSTLNLFAQRNTENTLFGWSFPAQLVSVGAADLRDHLGSRVCLALAPTGPAGTLEPGQVRPRPGVRVGSDSRC